MAFSPVAINSLSDNEQVFSCPLSRFCNDDCTHHCTKVTFSFDADKVFKDVPVNLLIDASGLYRNEDVILEFGIKANTLNLNLSQLLDDEGTCFDQTTGQATFGLSGSGNTFILSASSDFDFSKVFPEDSATTGFSFKIRCPVMISAIPPTPATPVSLTANGFG
jgi:hypothetical protein